MTTNVDIEELQTTKSEKLFAVVMTIFLLIGGVWAYQEIDDRVRERVELRAGTPSEQAALTRADRATVRVDRAERALEQARDELDLRRERYRTALDAGEPAAGLRAEYRAAERIYARAVRRRGAAAAAAAAAGPAAKQASRQREERFQAERRRERLVTLFLRLALAVVSFLTGVLLLSQLRRRNSRYLPLGGAVVAFGTVLALVVAADYLTDYFDPFELGILILSLMGVAITLLAFWMLQRYLRRRLPQRRVRKRQCPYCGFAAGEEEHCEGCGRAVLAPCARCDAQRRVGTRFCRACGQA